ncbi:MAG: hypothetical protein EOM68_31430 [Spirochaetia bacterium]|nr:hypothetical protein [Spirochaetia bacterium]
MDTLQCAPLPTGTLCKLIDIKFKSSRRRNLLAAGSMVIETLIELPSTLSPADIATLSDLLAAEIESGNLLDTGLLELYGITGVVARVVTVSASA